MSQWTPKGLEGKVQEWREKRAEKLAHRLQLNSDKKRTVSGQVLGMPTNMGGTTTVVQLPTPPSVQHPSGWRTPSAGAAMRKSVSYGDVHRGRPMYDQDHFNRSRQFLDSRRDEQVYHARNTQQQQRGAFTPGRSMQRDYRSFNRSHSEPRKSFAPHGFKKNFKPLEGASKHSNQPFISSKPRNFEEQLKYQPKSVLQSKSHETKKTERSVHFQDQLEQNIPTIVVEEPKQLIVSEDTCPVNDLLDREEIENKLNSTFLVEDAETSDPVKLEASIPLMDDVNQSSILDSVQTVETIEVTTSSFREDTNESDMVVDKIHGSPQINTNDVSECDLSGIVQISSDTVIPQITENCVEEPENTSKFSLTLELESTGDVESLEEHEQSNLGQTTPLKEELTKEKSPLKNNIENNLTAKMDNMFLTPMKSARKSRVLLDSTNIVESSCIRYMEVKKKDDPTEIQLTPVRRSTRNKTNQQQVSEDTLSKAKVVPNPFLNA